MTHLILSTQTVPALNALHQNGTGHVGGFERLIFECANALLARLTCVLGMKPSRSFVCGSIFVKVIIFNAQNSSL